MACIRKRRGKYVVDFRDVAGIRRWTTCETRKQAEAVLSEKLQASRQHTIPTVDPKITVATYAAERWLPLVKTSAKPRTVETYEGVLRRHLLPTFGSVPVARLHRAQLKHFLATKLASGMGREYVKLVLSVFHILLAAAQDDGVIVANPVAGLRRSFKLSRKTAVLQEEIKAMTRSQVLTLCAAADQVVPRLAALLLLLARTGLRLGEALALQWADLDFEAGTIRVARTVSKGQIGTPKSGAARDVDMTPALARRLRRLQVARKTEALRRGWVEVPAWIFCTRTGEPYHPRVVQRAFARVLTTAKLPEHFTPHALRHSYASILIAEGVSPAYVQRMLGHSSIKLTVDLYGKWLPMQGRGADRLDETPSGSKTVAAAMGGAQKLMISGTSDRQPPKSFFNASRKPPTSGPCSSPEDTRWYSSRTSRCLPVSFRGTSTTTV
jgi:integrase